MRCEIARDAEALDRLRPAWDALWRVSRRRPPTLHPAWIDAWRACFGGDGGRSFEGELLVVSLRDGNDLVAVAPFYLAPPRGGALRARELRVLGDGIIGLPTAVLVAPGAESQALDRIVEALFSEPGWDFFDVTFTGGAASGGDADGLGGRFSDLGQLVERDEVRGRPSTDLIAPWERFLEVRRPPSWIVAGLLGARLETCETQPALAEGLVTLESLARRFVPKEPVPGSSDPSMFRFLERALPALHDAGLGALHLLSAPGRGAIAGAVVLVDGDRHLEVVRAGEPDTRAADHLSALSLRRAIEAGARRFEFTEGGILASGRAQGQRLRVFRRSATGVLQRGYASLLRRAEAVADAARAPIDTITRLRDATPEAWKATVARVATFSQLHLYRGELFVKSPAPSPGLDIRLLSLSEFDQLDEPGRADLLSRLALDESYCRQKWERGDLVVLALLDGHPAGIVWCARGPVYVPDIGREVRPVAGECYIHDVFVPQKARGRAVAPAMLEFLARELRGRDVYGAWALIERTNTASTRAFEKARYASVADVIYARMGMASKLLVRPPDPDARAFLGLRPR